MFNWLRELYEIRRERLVCPTCDVLRSELDKERREKERLLNHILSPKEETPTLTNEAPTPVFSAKRPWRALQRELEARDSLKHQQIIKEFDDKVNPKAGDSSQIRELEKNLGIPSA
jgi:hypothetical protein